MRFHLLPIVLLATSIARAADPSFTVLLSPGVAPCTIHVNGLTAVPAGVDATTCTFAWDFGDPNGTYDTLPGFNAAHCYTHAGTYSIRLTFTGPDRKSRVMSADVVIGKDTRHLIFVSPDGSDGNIGTSPEAPARSLPIVFKKLGDECEVLLHAGGTYPLDGSLPLQGRDVLIGRYGDGPDPAIVKQNHGPIIATQPRCDGTMIQHIRFTTPNGIQPDGQAPKVGTDAIVGRGKNLTVRDCTFDNIDIGINANGSPVGLLVQNCTAPSVTSLRAYLVWGQGSDLVCLGNHVANSTREHCIRTSGVQRMLFAYNTLANLDRRPGDKYDTSKGCIEVHQGGFAWVTNNTVTDGDIRTGPLGGEHEPATTATDFCVIENNVLNETYVHIEAGSHHIRVRNNILHADGQQAFVIAGPDNFGRVSGDLTITGNTAVNHDAVGAFIRLWGKVDGLTLSSNLYIAPNLRPGASGTFFLATQQPDLADFTDIAGNVWPALPGNSAPFHLGSTGNASADKWLTTSPVKADRFENSKWVDPTSQPVQ